jgi:hypothetical protein
MEFNMRNLKSSIAAAMKLNQDHCGRGVSHLGGSLLAGVLIMVRRAGADHDDRFFSAGGRKPDLARHHPLRHRRRGLSV